MFIIFGGLPGVGKSTIAQSLAARIKAVYLRVDSIEQAVRSAAVLAPGSDVGPAGYMALYRVAADNLRLGSVVVADTVNPIEITRDAFRAVAAEANTRFVEIEVVCSDPKAHRHRAETRPPTVEGLIPPTWAEIAALHYEPWEHPHLRIDTAVSTVEESVARIMALL
ncbi:hypothetical protein ASE04_12665 [Rhizobium sp. Root708]|uniref:AAA family ATPase n=1 Tax=Rhizobium sp. Root708 TaxID=1736592 RepID=UPI0006F6C754|nr:AAA family ATPase [Rhizobium sp. Root708]KRB50770.1 hypothetical protein ASE04_12665 [Rhizobium sp. Root708]